MKKYVNFVNGNFLNVKTKMKKPINAGETSKNQVKYSLGLIPERINEIKKIKQKIVNLFTYIDFYYV